LELQTNHLDKEDQFRTEYNLNEIQVGILVSFGETDLKVCALKWQNAKQYNSELKILQHYINASGTLLLTNNWKHATSKHLCTCTPQTIPMLMGRLKSSEKQKRKKERRMTPMLPLARIMVLLHLGVGLSLYVIPKQASQALEAS
jgi:hypothetical protein